MPNQKMSFSKNQTACLTGHRPKSLPWGYNENSVQCLKFKEHLKAIIDKTIDSGITTFFTGMAEGFDMIAAEILIKLKDKHKNLKLIAAVPCLNQTIKWNINQQERYNNILTKCDKVIILSREYTSSCMIERNKYMVDNSSICIACYNGSPSGTGKTVEYARKKGLRILIISPTEI